MAYLAAAWTILAARVGLGRTSLAILLVGWLAWAVRFWFANRARTASTDLPLAKRWAETIADPDYKHIDSGKKLLGSQLVNVRSVPGGMAATVVLPPGQEGSQVDTRGEVIASVYGTLVTDVTIDESTAANKRELFVLPKSPLRKPRHWKGSDLDYATWISTVGSYIDGERVQYVWCIPESGPWHDLIAGTTRAGKSRLLDQLLTTSRQAKGYMVDWVIDPQNGQSLPDWVDEVDWFAAGVDEGMKVLRAARALMYARNLEFAGREHTDRRGRTKKGMKGFTPTLEYPQVNLTIDEAHAILQIPEAVTILAEMGKMGSKCGIKVRLVVHLPLLSELGGSSVLRDMVASGNVIVLRTASRITGQVAFQGALPVDPVTIPRRMPDGSAPAGLGFALGADSRRAPMRLDWVEDPLDIIEGVPITHLPDDEASRPRQRLRPVPRPAVRRGHHRRRGGRGRPGRAAGARGGPRARWDDVLRQVRPIVKAYANRAQYPEARVSRDEIVPKLLGTWKNQTDHQDHQGGLRGPPQARVVRRRPDHLLLQGGLVTAASSPAPVTALERWAPLPPLVLVNTVAVYGQYGWAAANLPPVTINGRAFPLWASCSPPPWSPSPSTCPTRRTRRGWRGTRRRSCGPPPTRSRSSPAP
jgi:hypothetical protein